MSWLSRIFESPPEAEGVSLIKLRSSRFRHLLRSYGKFLDLIADAAEKQGGDYILDKQYIVSMAEILFNLADAVVFDLNVMTNQRYGSLYDLMERFHMEVKKIITSWNEHSNRQRQEDRSSGPNP
jgi:hypothetical protein